MGLSFTAEEIKRCFVIYQLIVAKAVLCRAFEYHVGVGVQRSRVQIRHHMPMLSHIEQTAVPQQPSK